MLDVGQGDGILLQTRAGAVLVDEGPPEAGLRPSFARSESVASPRSS